METQRDGIRRFCTKVLPLRKLNVNWESRQEYIDQGVAGDDFVNRKGLLRLQSEVSAGDVVICRDASRIGRDALLYAVALRQIVEEKQARLFYYATGEEIRWNNAMDSVNAVFGGATSQTELENIRSRTREGIRSRVQAGRVAGGRCYGYTNERHKVDGREYTTASIHPQQAEVIRKIFDLYRIGYGLTKIAKCLNQKGTPSPSAGTKRGNGTWSASSIGDMLRRERFRGNYVHGRLEKKKIEGQRKTVEADNRDVLIVDMPEWRIIDEETWSAVQIALVKRATANSGKRRGPATKYLLSGLAKCGTCGHSICVGNTKSNQRTVKAYQCQGNRKCGKALCDVTIKQPLEEVEAALAKFVGTTIVSGDWIDTAVATIREQVDAFFNEPAPDTLPQEQELAQLRKEQSNFVKAISLGDEIPELVAAMKHRRGRIDELDAAILRCRNRPTSAEAITTEVERTARAALNELQTTLTRADTPDGQESLRTIYEALFPAGLVFDAAEKRNRRIWRISSILKFGGSNLEGDPNGIRRHL